jgi:hypothetical protein
MSSINANSTADAAYALNLRAGTTAQRSTAREPETAPSTGAGRGAVTVELSAEARAVLAQPPQTIGNRFAQYFPRRDGTSANMLSDGVEGPGRQVLSQGLSLGEVASAARASLDAQHQAMKASGKPFDVNSWEGKDIYTLTAGLDRRTLNAVAQNVGGQFSKDEQTSAQWVMDQQLSLATGLYSGPSSLAGRFVDVFGSDNVGRFKAGMAFLDSVSDEEKSTLAWAAKRAELEQSYNLIIDDPNQNSGHSREDVESDSPIVKLLRQAMGTISLDRMSGGPIRTVDDLKAQPWFEGFEDQFDALWTPPAWENPARPVNLRA